MELQQNWSRPVEVTDPDMIKDFANRFEIYSEAFKGEWFDAKVIYAYCSNISYKTKQGKDCVSEVLNLTLQITENNFTNVKIWGAKKFFDNERKEWGEPTKNPAELQDCLFIAVNQKPNALDESYCYSTEYEDRTVYPHLCGVKYKLIAGKQGEIYGRNGNVYDKNFTALFAPDGHSALEITENVTVKNDIRLALEHAKKLYADFCKENGTDDDTGYGQVAEPAPAPKKEAVVAKPFVDTTNVDDELPF